MIILQKIVLSDVNKLLISLFVQTLFTESHDSALPKIHDFIYDNHEFLISNELMK